MPAAFTRLENGVYHVELKGEIGLHELVSTQRDGLKAAQNQGDHHYVIIIQIASDTRMPFDIRQAGKLIENDDSLAVLSVGANMYMKFVVSVLARIFNLGHIEHFKTMTEAVNRARHLLQTHAENHPG